MTLRRMLRPVLVPAAVLWVGAMLASCSGADGQARSFESLAQMVSAVRINEASDPKAEPGRGGLFHPALRKPQPLQVQIMDPHDLWDARDGGLKGAVGQIGDRLAEAAAPVVSEVVIQRAALQVNAPPSLRPGPKDEPERTAPPMPMADPGIRWTKLQLGAYSDREAARLAWLRVSNGEARSALTGLSPLYETIDADGRRLTRLKVAAPISSAAAICRAAAASDPWCARLA